MFTFLTPEINDERSIYEKYSADRKRRYDFCNHFGELLRSIAAWEIQPNSITITDTVASDTTVEYYSLNTFPRHDGFGMDILIIVNPQDKLMAADMCLIPIESRTFCTVYAVTNVPALLQQWRTVEPMLKQTIGKKSTPSFSNVFIKLLHKFKTAIFSRSNMSDSSLPTPPPFCRHLPSAKCIHCAMNKKEDN